MNFKNIKIDPTGHTGKPGPLLCNILRFMVLKSLVSM